MWNYVLPSNELILDSDKVFFFRWGWLDIVVFRFFSIFLLPSLFSPSLCLLFCVSVHKRANFRLSLRDLRWLSHLFAYNLHAEVFIQDFHCHEHEFVFFLRKNCLESFEKWKDESAKSSWNDLPQRSLSWTSSLNKQFTYARSRILAQWLGIHFHFSIADTENLRN